MAAARKALQVMRANGRGIAEMGRASEVEATYWVHCPDLDALGEQRVLEALPVGMLLKVESATYRAPEPVEVKVPWEYLQTLRNGSH